MSQRSSPTGKSSNTSEHATHRPAAPITPAEFPTDANVGMAAKFGILRPPLFPLGRIVVTPSADALLKRTGTDATKLLARHQSGDHGDLSPGQTQGSQCALHTGAAIKSAYDLREHREPLWIITTASRTTTLLLLPHEEQ